MNTAYVLGGSNLGDRLIQLHKAAKLMEDECGEIISRSSVYKTAAWGITDQPDFYNQAFGIRTALLPAQLMQTLLDIENKMGRRRSYKMGPRTIDLDILLIDNLVVESELLNVPHPHLPQRRFALLPLAEIASNSKHPLLHKTIQELLEECKDNLEVTRLAI